MQLALRCALGGDRFRSHATLSDVVRSNGQTRAAGRPETSEAWSGAPRATDMPPVLQRGHPRVAHAARSAFRRALTGVSPAVGVALAAALVSAGWWVPSAGAQSVPGELCEEAVALRASDQCDTGSAQCPSGCAPVGMSCSCACSSACTRVTTWVASGGPPPAAPNGRIELECAAWGSTQNLWDCDATIAPGSSTLSCSCPQLEPPDDTIPCPNAVQTAAYRRCTQ